MAKTKSTKIILNDKYYVIIDNYNYTLFETKEVISPRTKEKSIKDIEVGYYPNMATLLKHLKRKQVPIIEGELTLDEYIHKLEKLEDWVTDIKQYN